MFWLSVQQDERHRVAAEDRRGDVLDVSLKLRVSDFSKDTVTFRAVPQTLTLYVYILRYGHKCKIKMRARALGRDPHTHTNTHRCAYTECPRRNGQNFGRVFLMLNYTDITQTPISKVERLRR